MRVVSGIVVAAALGGISGCGKKKGGPVVVTSSVSHQEMTISVTKDGMVDIAPKAGGHIQFPKLLLRMSIPKETLAADDMTDVGPVIEGFDLKALDKINRQEFIKKYTTGTLEEKASKCQEISTTVDLPDPKEPVRVVFEQSTDGKIRINLKFFETPKEGSSGDISPSDEPVGGLGSIHVPKGNKECATGGWKEEEVRELAKTVKDVLIGLVGKMMQIQPTTGKRPRLF